MGSPFIGEIRMFSGTFAPQDWLLCDGTIVSINDERYQVLFSIIGTTYGGNGRTNFALPDFRGRSPLGTGQGPGLPPFALGDTASEGAPTPHAGTGALAVTFIICIAGSYPQRP